MIRLSSLGDVILASSALSALPTRAPNQTEVHWLTLKEYAPLLLGHDSIAKLWEFDRRLGLKGWLLLCSQLWAEGFDEVYDLHSTLRSQIARVAFGVKAIFSRRDAKKFKWEVIGKQRLRLWGYYIFKALWPVERRPTPLVRRFSLLVGGKGDERPDLSHLLRRYGEGVFSLSEEFLRFAEDPYLCVMPSARWEGKKWSVRGFFEVVSKHGLPVVVLGSKQDKESVLLVKMLEQAGLPHFSGVGSFDFPQLAVVLSGSEGYLGNDTGLGHLAEAVGRPVVMLFGPTTPEMGFGPWRGESRAVNASLWCRPCGKDGRNCFRISNRHLCQKKIDPKEVAARLREISKVNP